MAYSDFTLQLVEAKLGITLKSGVLFPIKCRAPVPEWLREQLDRGRWMPLLSEKARSESIVTPVLLACCELSQGAICVYSGARMDVSPQEGLTGECDFLLARTPPFPELRAPLVAVVEAKKNDLEAALGQCVAEMMGARVLNERTGSMNGPIYGCVTTGEVWQFLRLERSTATIDEARYYLDNLAGILGVFQAILGSDGAES